jgi:hypothetical protein
MRKLGIGTKKHTQVYALDEKGQGNANHSYSISTTAEPSTILGTVNFQDGPIKEHGVNGIHNEDLIAIVIDRLQGFQSGDYACRDNAIALTKLEESLMWLRNRTNAREARGVEGTHKI